MADSSAGAAREGRPAPFEDVVAPWVESAGTRLWGRWPGRSAPVTEAVRLQLARALARELAAIGGQVFLRELERARGVGPPGPDPRAGYRRFRRAMRDALGRDYPALAGLLADRASLWVDATDELLRRLVEDGPVVSRTLARGVALGPVTNVRTALSDPHGGGRSVCLLRFASGDAIAYKPRSLALEGAFDALVRWLNARGLAPAPRSLAVVDRGTHGWMEVAEAAPCADAAEVRLYYERAGILLGLAHALGGSDLHGENVIACGPDPVLVDLEVLMAAPARPHGAGSRGTEDTVLWTQLLPYAVPDPEEGRARVEGGFATRAPGEQRLRRGWRRVGADGMEPFLERAPAPDGPNAPRLDGEVVGLDRELPAFLDGFRRLYRTLLDHRAALAAPGGPLEAFADARTRVVLRDTRAYLSSIRASLRPEALRADGSRTPALAPLPVPDHLPPALAAALRRCEHEALLRLDVPAFAASVDARALTLPDGTCLPAFFAESGGERARRRLAEMGEDDLETQAALVRMRVASYRALQEQALAPNGDERFAGRQALAEAARIGRLVESLAEDGAGGASWKTIERAAGGTLRVRPLGPGLGGGRSGVALFLAALHRALPSDRTRSLALSALDGAALEIEAGRQPAEPGFEHGVGGVLYALVRAAGWLGEPRLRARAEAMAALFAAEPRWEDAPSDVARGLGGYALGLAALCDGGAGRALRAQALEVGMTLARRQLAAGAGAGAWADADGRTRVGFGTGAAGIAWALRRLECATCAGALGDAALRAERFVDGLFVAEIGDWLDAPVERGASPRLARPRGSWSAGAAGIGLARVHAPERPRADATLVRALGSAARALAEDAAGPDTLSDGALGAIELLQEEERRTGGVGQASAVPTLGEIVRRARVQGTYRLNGDDAHRPDLFGGIAGVGFVLLRSADPSLPCALLGA